MDSITNRNTTTIMMILNIGLNNNAMSVEEILEALVIDYKVYSFHQAEGSYNEAPEPTLVVYLTMPYHRTSHKILRLEQLTNMMKQECIAVSSDHFDMMVYAHNYNGERLKFDSRFFIG